MPLKDFSEYVNGKTFDEILHEGRKESAERILSEALTPLALMLSRELLKVLLLPPQALEELVPTPLDEKAQ
jgi:ribosomal protein S7